MATAIDVVADASQTAGLHYLIAERSGKNIGLETSTTDFQPLYALDDVPGHWNHYVHPAMLYFDRACKPWKDDSIVPHRRINRLLRHHRGRIIPDLLKTFTCGHDDRPTSICRHWEEGHGELETGGTVASLVMDLGRRTLWATAGHPCDRAFEGFRVPEAPAALVASHEDRIA